ncbi:MULTISPECIES: hypothetical protein [Acinetobacter]|uniref:Uncharacterized protein n=2 Tax=Bacteria TaxID=2 RepID=A0ABX9TT39_9GAMM|nr:MULTISPECIES: hypothetical protein [Acinetobacter]MBI1453194.1 hypothetical protein [Acinetobacter sp. FL51]RKG42368.1 hypothetical protein D7V31_07515 [Acinetobacter sp. WCHAc060007]RLL18552.1 hypothetical protein D9K81_15245 [Acinetobacter chengduensis]
MSNKDQFNEIALTTTENLAKEFLLGTATSFLDELAKAIPFASSALALSTAYSNFKTAQEKRQLLAFIQEIEINKPDFINKFFKDKNNTELGLEILGILDQTYLEKQARMIGRVTILLKNLVISKQEFDKYTYIITKLNNHLITIIKELHQASKDATHSTFHFPSPNMDLISFEFLVEVENNRKFTTQSNYQRTEFFYYFYENIFKD